MDTLLKVLSIILKVGSIILVFGLIFKLYVKPNFDGYVQNQNSQVVSQESTQYVIDIAKDNLEYYEENSPSDSWVLNGDDYYYKSMPDKVIPKVIYNQIVSEWSANYAKAVSDYEGACDGTISYVVPVDKSQ